MFFSLFPYWIKEKSMATLANRDICEHKCKTSSQFSHHITTPFSSVVIYMLLVASSLWNALWMCLFESIFEIFFCWGELYNDSRFGENVYKVLTFKIISWKVLVCFERCFVWNVCEQATTSILPTQKKVFVLFLLL